MTKPQTRWVHGDETAGWTHEVTNPETGFRVRHVSTDGTYFYFWDETQTDAYGPFVTLGECKEALNKYAHWLNEGPS